MLISRLSLFFLNWFFQILQPIETFKKKNEEIQLYTCMEKLNYTF